MRLTLKPETRRLTSDLCRYLKVGDGCRRCTEMPKVDALSEIERGECNGEGDIVKSDWRCTS